MSKYPRLLLFMIFALVLAARLYFAFSIGYFSSDDSYFHLRQVESIRDSGLPIFDDDFSYSGRSHIFSPVFHYIIAFFALFMPVLVAAKVLTSIFAASLVIIIYLIARKITGSNNVALFTSFLSGFVPVFFAETATRLSPLSLGIPLVFLLIYALMNIKDTFWQYCYLAVLVFLSFASPIILLYVLGLGIYLLIVVIERLKQGREVLEISVFSIFFVLWAQFLLYKKIFLFHGLSVVWQNIPKEILGEHFAATTILSALFQIGVIPFVIGLYVIYLHLFKIKKDYIYLIMSFAASAGLLLWMRLIELKIGLMFFGLVLVVLFAEWYKEFLAVVKKSKVSHFIGVFSVLFFAAFLLLSVYPSFSLAEYNAGQITESDIKALQWLSDNTPARSTVAATVHEGNLITAVAKRKNVIDSDFMMQRDASVRLNDIRRIFTAFMELEAVDLMDKYYADYIYFSGRAKAYFNIQQIKYIDDGKCFVKVYDDNIQIYQKLPECRVRTV